MKQFTHKTSKLLVEVVKVLDGMVEYRQPPRQFASRFLGQEEFDSRYDPVDSSPGIYDADGKIRDPLKIKPLDLSSLLRHAFFAGAGYGDFQTISDADQKRWVEYDPSELAPFKRIDAALRGPSAGYFMHDYVAAEPGDPDIPVTQSLLAAAIAELKEWKVAKGGDDQVALNLEATLQRAVTGAVFAASIDTPLRIYPDEMTDEIRAVLQLMVWNTGGLARALRIGGEEIETAAEAEQSHVLHWLLKLALDHGDKWRDMVGKRLDEIKAQTKEKADE